MSGRILVADGDPAGRLGLAARLGAAYYDVIVASDGAQALRLAREVEPDLVVLSPSLGGVGGLEACKRLKSDPRLSHVPVVMLAPRDAAPARLSALRAGADDLLSTPLEDLELLARTRALIRMKVMADELRLRAETAAALGLRPSPGPGAAGEPDGGGLMVVDAELGRARRRGAVLSRALGLRAILPADPRAALDEALVSPPDLVLIREGADGAGAALRLVSALRARPATRGCGIVLILRPGARKEAAAALDLGASDFVPEPVDMAELTARLECQLRRKRFSDLLRDTVRDGLMMAVTDQLTGLFNRRYAETHLTRLIGQCDEAGEPMALMMLDLDRFKLVNDRHGHPAGDAVLRGFAARLRAEVRGADLVARLGGEEFCIALPGASAAKARAVAERVRQAVESKPFDAPGAAEPLCVTVSIGIAVTAPQEAPRESGPQDMDPRLAAGLAERASRFARRPAPDPAARLMALADRALYASKTAGRNRISIQAAA